MKLKQASELARAVEKSGKRRERIAADAGISVQHLRNLEAGGRNPSLGVARAIARALGTKVDRIFPPEAAEVA